MNNQHDSTKNQLLSVAKALFSKNGFENTTVRMISETSGLTTGCFYYYFESKPALFSSIVSETANLLENDVLILLQQRRSNTIGKFEYSSKISNILFPRKTEFLLLFSRAQGSSYQNFSKEYANKLAIILNNHSTNQNLDLFKIVSSMLLVGYIEILNCSDSPQRLQELIKILDYWLLPYLKS